MFGSAVNPIRLALCAGVLISPGFATGAAAEVLLGKVTAVTGKAEIVLTSGRKSAAVGMELKESDLIETGAGGAIQVRFADGSSFTVYEKSSIKIDQYRVAPQNRNVIDSAVDILHGKLRFFVNPDTKKKKNAKFKTKSAVMGIRGTSGVIDAANPNQTQLLVLSGKVEVTNPRFPARPVFVGANLMTSIPAAAVPSQPVQVSGDFLKAFVPETPKSAGFSDDSATAASAFGGTSPVEGQKPKSDEEKPPASEPQPKKDPEPSSTQKDGGSQRGKTLFAPGGEVIRPAAESGGIESSLSSAAQGKKGTAKQGKPTAGAAENTPVERKSSEKVPAVDVLRQVDKTTTQIKSTVETVERNVQQTIQVIATPAPAPQKIKVKINLPGN